MYDVIGPQAYPDSCPTLATVNGIINVNQNPFKVTVYPNPFNDKIVIGAEIANEGDMQATIFDLLGQIVAFSDFGTKSGQVQESMSVSTLSSGVYVIQVSVNNRSLQTKMIKINN